MRLFKKKTLYDKHAFLSINQSEAKFLILIINNLKNLKYVFLIVKELSLDLLA